MLNKVKKALGIEGVKVEIDTDRQHPKVTRVIKGHVVLTSLSDNVVEHIHIKVVERYSRGRKKDRLVNDYEIGKVNLHGPIEISPHEPVSIAFEVPYIIARSEMDELGDTPIVGGLIALAKYLKKVKSTYRIIAEVEVTGTKLQPFAEQEIALIGKH